MDLNKTIGQQTGNAKGHLDTVSVHSQQTSDLHEKFSDDLHALNKQMMVLKEKVRNNPADLKKFLKSILKPLESQLLVGEETQKNQNKLSQEIMTEIKRENKETSESIIKAFELLKSLEVRVGKYD